VRDNRESPTFIDFA